MSRPPLGEVVPLHQRWADTTVCLHCGKPLPWPPMDPCPRPLSATIRGREAMTPETRAALAKLPGVREAASKMAREAHDAWEAAIRASGGTRFLIEQTIATRAWYGVEEETTAHLTLLCDLTRPASRDWWARYLAQRLGLTVGATAPDFGRYTCGEHCCDGDNGRMVPCSRPIWSLMAADETQLMMFADCPDPGEWDGGDRRHVPGISALTDPAEALAAACIHVGGLETP